MNLLFLSFIRGRNPGFLQTAELPKRQSCRRALFALLAVLCITHSSYPQSIFRDIAEDVGLIPGHDEPMICEIDLPMASGSAWGDYDNDGDVDLFVTNAGGPNRLYRNNGDLNGDGLPDFENLAAAFLLEDSEKVSHSAVFIDYDNDGDQDLYVTHWGGNTLYQNRLADEGTVSFLDVTSASGLADEGRAMLSAWGDFDRDGFLDVYLAKHQYCEELWVSDDRLYRNNGDGTFTNVSGWLCPEGNAPCQQLEGAGFSAAWVDYDNDADPDLYLVNEYPKGPYVNVLWRNDGTDGKGGWIFTDVSQASGADIELHSMGLGVGDYDNDGWFEFAVSNTGPNYLLHSMGDGTFEDVSESAGIQREWIVEDSIKSVTWGTVFFDYDNNQLLDLYYIAGRIGKPYSDQPNAFFRNNGDGTFTDESASSGLDDPQRGRCASIVDLNNDGFVDVFIGNLYMPPVLYLNEGLEAGNQNHWLTVTVEGTVSNRDGIGTRLRLVTPDGVAQIREINSGPTYGGGDYRAAFFGAGSNTEGELIVRWPNGAVQNMGIVATNQTIHLTEPATAYNELIVGVDAGGRGFTDSFGNVFSADQEYTPGSYGYLNGRIGSFPEDVSGTVDIELFQGLRASQEPLIYQFDGLKDGQYDIVLLFVEPKLDRAGTRIFDVVVGGDTLINNLDVFAESGGKFAALVRTVSGQVRDGQLRIEFVPAGTKHALVCAIGIAPGGTVQKIGTPVAATEKSLSAEQSDGLLQNYPNPANPSTAISYIVTEGGHVTLSVYNILGQMVTTLVDDYQAPGARTVHWKGTTADGRTASSGTYFVRLATNNSINIRKIQLLR